MKLLKSLTLLTIVIFLTSCANNKQSATFSLSSEQNTTTSVITSSNEPTSIIPSEPSSSNAGMSSSLPPTNAEIYDGYYQGLVSWQNGEDLKNQLHAIIRNGYQPLSYKKSSTANYQSNIDADHSKYDFEYLDVIYSQDPIFKSATNKGWQREHAWCASLMCGSTTDYAVNFKGRATDFHNLFAASAGGNQSRGNKNYGYADLLDSFYTDRTVNNGNDGYSFDETIFEPADIDKGRLARAIFYMATMYKDEELDTANNIRMKGLKIVEEPVSYVSGNNCAFAIGNLSDLLEWNTDTPVDYLEMQHNVSVYSNTNNPDGYAQGNRNPYVDFPELVDYVYGNKKDQPGELKDLTASARYLDSESIMLSHYAIKSAIREYGYGEKFNYSDVKIIGVLNNYQLVETTTTYSCSLLNHEFHEDDGDNITVEIVTPTNSINYQIVLNPMARCSSGILNLTKEGINDKKPNEEQSVKYQGYDFYFSFTTTYSSVSTNGMTLSNDNQKGGFYLGSGTKVLTGVTLKSKESYTIDQAYVKAYAGNASSAFDLIIKVGDQVLVDTQKVTYNQATYAVYGGKKEAPLTGQLSFIFTGSNKLYLNSIAFNSIIV